MLDDPYTKRRIAEAANFALDYVRNDPKMDRGTLSFMVHNDRWPLHGALAGRALASLGTSCCPKDEDQ